MTVVILYQEGKVWVQTFWVSHIALAQCLIVNDRQEPPLPSTSALAILISQCLQSACHGFSRVAGAGSAAVCDLNPERPFAQYRKWSMGSKRRVVTTFYWKSSVSVIV